MLLLYFTFYLCWACFVCICVAFLCIYVAFVLCLCILGGISTIREGIALHPPLHCFFDTLWHKGAQMKIKYLAKKLLASSKSYWTILFETYYHWMTSLFLAPLSLYITPPPLRKITIRTSHLIFIILFTLTFFKAQKFYTQTCICDKNC